jgi:hypothetical protein
MTAEWCDSENWLLDVLPVGTAADGPVSLDDFLFCPNVWFRRLLHTCQLSESSMAAKLGVDKTEISKWLNWSTSKRALPEHYARETVMQLRPRDGALVDAIYSVSRSAKNLADELPWFERELRSAEVADVLRGALLCHAGALTREMIELVQQKRLAGVLLTCRRFLDGARSATRYVRSALEGGSVLLPQNIERNLNHDVKAFINLFLSGELAAAAPETSRSHLGSMRSMIQGSLMHSTQNLLYKRSTTELEKWVLIQGAYLVTESRSVMEDAWKTACRSSDMLLKSGSELSYRLLLGRSLGCVDEGELSRLHLLFDTAFYGGGRVTKLGGEVKPEPYVVHRMLHDMVTHPDHVGDLEFAALRRAVSIGGPQIFAEPSHSLFRTIVTTSTYPAAQREWATTVGRSLGIV